MRKLIGITTSMEEGDHPRHYVLPRLYADAVKNVGAMPMIFPIITEDIALISEMVDRVDGIILSGGVDVDPQLFGEEPDPNLGRIDPQRDVFELQLAQIALKKDKPILGICRGCQVLNIAAQGTVVQDIAAYYGPEKVYKHSQSAPRWHLSHAVELLKGSKLAEIFGCTTLQVNSFHHQAVKDPAPGFLVTAKAKDGVIEAIESVENKYVIGVQWHPELVWKQHPQFVSLFQSLIDAC